MIFRLIIPETLGQLSLQAGTRGWFKGSVIETEKLVVAYASQVGEQEHFLAPGSTRLFGHWALYNGTLKDQLIPWVAVKSGFGFALAASPRTFKDELTDWVADGEALGLPDGNVSSLCCLEPTKGEDVILHLLLVLPNGRVLEGVVHRVAAEPHTLARLDGLRPMEALKEKRVALIGVGSGGSMAALNLAAAGVGTLQLFDKDDLTTDNLFRHACDLRHVGRAKVLAVRDLIRTYDLPSEVVPHEQDVLSKSEDLWGLMDEVDLVLCATDTVLSRRLVNYICVHTMTPLVMACTFRNARIGEIIRVLPGESACYECTRLALREAGALEPVEDGDDLNAATVVPYGLPEEAAGGVTVTTSQLNQGTRSDVAMVAALVSRIAVMTLLADSPDVDRLPRDYMVWGSRIESGLHDPFNFKHPFGMNWVPLPRREDCPVCGTSGAPPDPEVNEEYESIMASLTVEVASN
jgi:molybdopterin/thiamine biosynthesis adenylyltransferase